MIRRLAGSPVLRLFSTAVIDQAILSAANLVLVLLLIRYTESHQYGYFVLVQVGIVLLTSILGAWVSGPLSVLAPKRTDAQRDAMLGEVSHSLDRFLIAALPLGFAIPLLAGVTGATGWEYIPLVLAGVPAAILSLRREFARAGLRIQARARALLIADASYVAVLLVGAAIAVNVPGPAAVWALFAVTAAAAVGDFTARRALSVETTAGTVTRRAAWKEMRPLGVWATVGTVIYWAQSQSFNYALAAKLTVEAVAHVNAARLLLMPIFLISTGVSSLLLPSASSWLHHDGLPKLVRRIWMFVGALLVMDLIYLLIMWFARDWITVELMKKTIPDRDVLILLWAAHALFGMAHEMFQAVLLALGRFRVLAWVSGFAAIASLGTAWFGVQHFGAPAAIMGTAAGELTFLIGIAILLPQSLRRDRAQRAAAAATPAQGPA